MRIMVENNKGVVKISHLRSNKVLAESTKAEIESKFPGWPTDPGAYSYMGWYVLAGTKDGQPVVKLPTIYSSETRARTAQLIAQNAGDYFHVFKLVMPWNGVLTPCWISHEVEKKGVHASGLLYPKDSDVVKIANQIFYLLMAGIPMFTKLTPEEAQNV